LKLLPAAAVFFWLGYIVAGWQWIGAAEAGNVIADRIHPSTKSNKIYTAACPFQVFWREATTDMGYEQSLIFDRKSLKPQRQPRRFRDWR
jgi:hypothetical protein